MKKKTKQVITFIEGLHYHITKDPTFRKDVGNKSETAIQAEIFPLIISYLEKHFNRIGFKDYRNKALKSFYWEGQEG